MVLGVPWPVFLGLTVGLFGCCAFLSGQSAAQAWRPLTAVLINGLLLGAGDRFLVYALFGGPLWSLAGYLSHSAVLITIAVFAYRLTLAQRMVSQYPWLYQRTGPFSWRERAPSAS